MLIRRLTFFAPSPETHSPQLNSTQLLPPCRSHRDVDDCVLGLLRGRLLAHSAASEVAAVEQVVVAVLSQQPKSVESRNYKSEQSPTVDKSIEGEARARSFLPTKR